ncbi:MAG: GNAT family N-acetyltransferase [Alphaproteobacteria bacterium]|nr:GNAT family N-acetyltransferase [Alphaproteobacteria bacterium]
MADSLPPVFIRKLASSDLAAWGKIVVPLSGYSADAYMAQAFAEQESGRRRIIGAFSGEEIVGYVFLNFQPLYQPFRSLNIPEFQDLHVVPAMRGRGVAAALVAFCETAARECGAEMIGLGVSVHKNFGPAQRLYAKLGYSPDGNGIVHERQNVTFGELKPVGDDLCLMMIKRLA